MGFLQNLFGLGSDRKKLSDPSFGYLFDKPPADEWISLDLEMTGLNPKTDHILSVGAVRIFRTDGVLSVDTANALSLVCRPPVMPSTDSIVIHGLRPMDVENGVGYDGAVALYWQSSAFGVLCGHGHWFYQHANQTAIRGQSTQ